MIRHTFRSPDLATTVGTTPIGEALPATIAPATPAVPAAADPVQVAGTPPAAQAPQRIEDVMKAIAAQHAAAAPAEAAPAEPPSAEALTVTLPPRRDGEDPLNFTAQTPEQVEALRRLNNGYLRGEQARALETQARTQLAEYEAFQSRIQSDPVGVLLEMAPAEVQVGMLEALISSNFDAMKPVIDRLYGNPEAMAQARANITDNRTQHQQQHEARQQQVAAQTAIESAVGAMIPDMADSHAATEFATYAAYALNDALQRAPETVTPETVPQLLGSLAARYFGSPAAPESGRSTAPAPVAPATPAVPASGMPVNPAVMQARTAARAVAPQGAGVAPVTMPQPPKGQTIEERVAWMRQNMAQQGAR